jgi:hypothetical protein
MAIVTWVWENSIDNPLISMVVLSASGLTGFAAGSVDGI